MSTVDDAQAAVTAAQTVLADVSSTASSPADNVLAAVVASLLADGYTVTPPALANAPELPEGDVAAPADTTS